MNSNEIDIGNLILQQLKDEGRTLVWLAKQVGCDNSNLTKMLRNSRYINVDLLFRISIALRKDFFIHYSQKLKERDNW